MQEKGQFVAQIKELESFNNELRVLCRKVSAYSSPRDLLYVNICIVQNIVLCVCR